MSTELLKCVVGSHLQALIPFTMIIVCNIYLMKASLTMTMIEPRSISFLTSKASLTMTMVEH